MSKQFQKAKLYWNICKKPYNIEYRDGKIKVFPNLWSFFQIFEAFSSSRVSKKQWHLMAKK